MIDAKQIPDEVDDALVDALQGGMGVKQALAAALNAWPGAQFKMNGAMRTFLILPLPKDAADE